MRVLICNDDGVHAPGINVLKDVLSEVADVTVVAPLEERSTTGHTLSLDNPLRLIEISKDVYGCSGFPADCALMGLGHVMKNDKPDLVISGINRGANLGQDIYYSGTVAAAREATFHNIPAIAVSSVVDFLSKVPTKDYYETAANFVKELLLNNVVSMIKPMHLLNINVPNISQKDIQGVEITDLGFRHYSEEITEREDFRGRKYYWIGGIYRGHFGKAGSDCFSVEQSKISLSPLNLLNQVADKSDEWSKFINKLNW